MMNRQKTIAYDSTLRAISAPDFFGVLSTFFHLDRAAQPDPAPAQAVPSGPRLYNAAASLHAISRQSALSPRVPSPFFTRRDG
jgi:hypothetical protein